MSAATLGRISSLFSTPIYELDGALLTGDSRQGRKHLQEFGPDLTGLEAFVNHYHLSEFIGPTELPARGKRACLMKLGAAVVTVWSERLRHRLGRRTILFYLGGRSDVILRFHVERRSSSPWAPLDPEFLRRERVTVFRASQTALKELG